MDNTGYLPEWDSPELMEEINKKKMKEHPILFSTPMVQALLAGRKSQTRRIVKPQPGIRATQFRYDPGFSADKPWAARFKCEMGVVEKFEITDLYKCPFGQPGDILWVRESFRKYFHVDEYGYTHYDDERLDFKADGHEELALMDADGYQLVTKDGTERYVPWKPSIHMPKAAARIWLQIESVRVERLQDISEEDAVAEGIEVFDTEYDDFSGRTYQWFNDYGDDENSFADPRKSFQSLWQSINGPESWQANPWVWCVSFKVLSTTGKPY